MFNFFSKKQKPQPENNAATGRFQFFDVGFHGDTYLLKVVDALAARSKNFIETGANVGSTLGYFARRFPKVNCYSCEPNPEAYQHALKNAGVKNVKLFNETSQEFIARLKKDHSAMYNEPTLFWLDAHGYGFQWPLIEEMVFIQQHFKSYYILIDDFEVPGIPAFGYDVYEGQYCTDSYIREHLKGNYHLYYPTYSEKTSKHHPLRGWGLYSSEPIDWNAAGINFVREETNRVSSKN